MSDVMSETTDQLKKEIERSRDLLRTLRDELKVKLHLAGMDAKDAFEKLDHEAREISHTVSETTRLALADVIDRMRKIRESLRS
jgi:hypothetical protein